MKLRGAIAGFGAVAAEGHLPGWVSRPEIQIVAICDPAAERRHHALRILKGVRVYDDLGLMLDGERPDFVDVASPPAMHAAAARAALEAGAHVIVEKPLCLDLAELDALIELARLRERVLMCVHNWKHAPAYRRAHEMVVSGRLGTLREVTLERLRTAPAGGEGPGARWRRDAALGGGILADHGWHTFYLAQWLMGGAAPRLRSSRLSGDESGGAEEIADLELAFPDHRGATIHLSWRAARRRTSASLKGEHGMVEIESNSIRITTSAGASERLSVADATDDSYHAAWFGSVAAEFTGAMSAGGGIVADRNLAEAKAALAIIAAARAAR